MTAFARFLDGGKSAGATRVSLGLASNFADVERFLRLAAGFRDQPTLTIGAVTFDIESCRCNPRRKLTATEERHRQKLTTAGSSADRIDAWKRRFGTGQVAHNLLKFKDRNIMYRTLSMAHRRQVLN